MRVIGADVLGERGTGRRIVGAGDVLYVVDQPGASRAPPGLRNLVRFLKEVFFEVQRLRHLTPTKDHQKRRFALNAASAFSTQGRGSDIQTSG